MALRLLQGDAQMKEREMQDLVAAMMSKIGGVEIKDRRYRFKNYKQCFLGVEAHQWIQTYLKCAPEDALKIGQLLMDNGFVSHVIDPDKRFESKKLFYRIHNELLLNKLQKRIENVEHVTAKNRRATIRETRDVKCFPGQKPYDGIPECVKGKQLQTGESFDLTHQPTPYGVGCSKGNCHAAMMSNWNDFDDMNMSLEQVKEEAKQYITQYYLENYPDQEDAAKKRLAEVENEISQTGTYTHTFKELEFGCRLAWRNASRCINRIQWNRIELIDKRDVTTNEGMIESCFGHMKFANNGGALISTITVFPPKKPGASGPRVWNDQLIRYAGYPQPDGTIVGDPANVEITEVFMKLGWQGRGTRFDVLPLVVQAEGSKPEWKEIPSDLILSVPITHPEHSWFAEMGLRWYALPAISSFGLTLGGIYYPAVPFSGWYMATEIARNFADEGRYNMLPEIALKMGLKISNAALWKDRTMLELTYAILSSFQSNGVAIVDHHTASDSFVSFYRNEMEQRGYCPADWVWITPPISGSTTQVFHLEMLNYILKPAYVPQPPAWTGFTFSEVVVSSAQQKMKKNANKLKKSLNLKEISVNILYATETGKSETFARQLVPRFKKLPGAQVNTFSTLNDFVSQKVDLKKSLWVIVTSTFGSGEPPRNAILFNDWLDSLSEPNCLSKISFAVWGNCNKLYTNFNAFGRFIHQRMLKFGATAAHSLGEGDELEGQDILFSEWTKELFTNLQPEGRGPPKMTGFSSRTQAQAQKPKKSESSSAELEPKWEIETMKASDVVEYSFDSSKPTSQVNPYVGELIESVNLTESSHTTNLVRISIKGSSVSYHAGDHIGILPVNTKENVDKMLEIFGIKNPDEVFVVRGPSDEVPEFLQRPTTYRKVLTNDIDIGNPPGADALNNWSNFATGEEKDELVDLGTGGESYRDWITGAYPTHWQVFELFKTLRLPFIEFIKTAKKLQPRFYSVSSSNLEFLEEIHLTVAQVVFTCIGVRHFGVCSNFLGNSPPGTKVRLFIRSAPEFHLPKDNNAPVIMVGPGSGVAPFRGFIQQAKHEKRKEMLLFFGCRTPKEFIHQNELEEAQQQNIAQTIVAYSRIGQTKEYVQHKLMENNHAVWEAFQNGGHFYVCGDVRMANDVDSVLKKLIGEFFTSSPEKQAADFLERMKKEGRYHVDIYGLTLHVKRTMKQNMALWDRVVAKVVAPARQQVPDRKNRALFFSVAAY